MQLETEEYMTIERVNAVRERAGKLRRQFLKYKDAESVYSLTHRKLLEMADEAGAICRIDGTVLIGLRFGVVVTIKEMYGINRIDEFIKNCNLNGWLVNAIDIQNRIEIHEKINEEIRFD